ncbi:MAG: hypothetical protein R2698_02270 [Microthrixaceae bacterium]
MTDGEPYGQSPGEPPPTTSAAVSMLVVVTRPEIKGDTATIGSSMWCAELCAILSNNRYRLEGGRWTFVEAVGGTQVA